MAVVDLLDLPAALPVYAPVMGLDLGERTIGVAVSDATRAIASPLELILKSKFTDDAKRYLERYGKGTKGTGWRSFDHQGVHFVGLVNVMNLKAGGLGVLGQDQLDWLKKDVSSLGDSTPIVVCRPTPSDLRAQATAVDASSSWRQLRQPPWSASAGNSGARKAAIETPAAGLVPHFRASAALRT